MVADLHGNSPKPDAYREELTVIKTRIETMNDYDWVKKTENIGDDYEPLLENRSKNFMVFSKSAWKI